MFELMPNKLYKIMRIAASVALLAACGGNQALAPVSSPNQGARESAKAVLGKPPLAKKAVHQVQAGDTLYSLAWKYGYDPQQLADWNKLRPPYRIHLGQLLQVAPPAATLIARTPSADAASPPITSSRIEAPQMPPNGAAPPAAISPPGPDLADSVRSWKWPTEGNVIQRFSVTGKGLSIAGKESQPIHAAAEGRVVYRGSGLIGLGELVILKHDKSFLSAYAHNKKILVKEGDKVAMGQPIAEMGKTGAERVMLYFEIRKDGKPVDPLLYLPRRN